MTHADVENELRNITARASHVEAARQQARQAGDWPKHASLELELARLGRRAVELERLEAERAAELASGDRDPPN